MIVFPCAARSSLFASFRCSAHLFLCFLQYLAEPVAVKAGDIIKGHIDVKRNDKNPRDLDIEMAVGKGKIPAKATSYRLR